MPPKNPALRNATFVENIYTATAPRSNANIANENHAHELAFIDERSE
jgi:hypothetical protein